MPVGSVISPIALAMAHISVEQLLLDVVYITATVARSPSAKTYADDSETSDWSVSEYTTCSTQGDRCAAYGSTVYGSANQQLVDIRNRYILGNPNSYCLDV